MKLVNKVGQERLDGGVADDDKIVVTSANGQVTRTYYIAKLSSTAIPDVLYLAYILSPVYAVDQVDYKVSGVDGAETVSNFLTNVTPAQGASVAVVDKDGVVKINGDINGGDMVKVTSADGKIVVMYSFGILTSNKTLNQNEISVYPNPTNNEIKVAGAEPGNRIRVINSVGTIISDVNVVHNIESFSLTNKSAGIYMVIISKNNSIIGSYKVIKF